MSNDKINFVYDAARQGYSTTIFKPITGTPTAASNALRLNAAKIVAYADIYKADVTLTVNVPAVPTSGDVRSFGLQQVNDTSKAVFLFTGAVFSCNCYDSLSNTTKNVVVPWVAGWEGAATDYKIKWTGFSCEFFINGLSVAFINDLSVPKQSLSVFANNGNSDNMDITSIQVQNAQGYIAVT